MKPGLMESGITWYNVLGVLPGGEARKIKREYDGKAALLRPELISGAPPNVLTAVTRAQELLDTAWEVLGDPESRKRYDEAVGLRRSGGGLGQPGTGPADPALRPADLGRTGERGGDAAGGLLALTGGLTTWCAISVGACWPGRLAGRGYRSAARSEISPPIARKVSSNSSRRPVNRWSGRHCLNSALACSTQMRSDDCLCRCSS